MNDLAKRQCQPCRGDSQPVPASAYAELLAQLPGWQIVADGVPQLVKNYKFNNYQQCLDFAMAIGQLAEQQDHHPELVIRWGEVRVSWWTHIINGLHLNDFILAARTELL